MRSPTKSAAALVGLLAAAAGPLAAPAAATTVATRGGRPTCKRAGSRTIASSPQARVYAITGRDDGEYGAPTTIVGCWRAKERRRVALLRHGVGQALFVDRKRLAGRYVALQTTVVDAACTKYMGSSPECFTYRLASYDVRTGRHRAQGDGAPAAFALTTRGWLAWVTAPDGSGAATVFARDGAGRRQLDAGAIDPRSLSVTDDVVSWTRDGVEQTATVR